METVSQLCISHRRKFITTAEFENLSKAADELARMLSGLKKNLNSRK